MYIWTAVNLTSKFNEKQSVFSSGAQWETSPHVLAPNDRVELRWGGSSLGRGARARGGGRDEATWTKASEQFVIYDGGWDSHPSPLHHKTPNAKQEKAQTIVCHVENIQLWSDWRDRAETQTAFSKGLWVKKYYERNIYVMKRSERAFIKDKQLKGEFRSKLIHIVMRKKSSSFSLH